MGRLYDNEFDLARARIRRNLEVLMSILSRKIRSVDPRKIRPIMTNFGTNSNGEILEFLNACPSKTWILEFTAGLMSEDETFIYGIGYITVILFSL